MRYQSRVRMQSGLGLFADIDVVLSEGPRAVLGPLIDQDGTAHPELREPLSKHIPEGWRVRVRELRYHAVDSRDLAFEIAIRSLFAVVDGRRGHHWSQVTQLDPVTDPVVFVSGHLDVTTEEFEAHYVPQLQAAVLRRSTFVMGDARGADRLAQAWCAEHHADARVFHMFEHPRFNEGSHPVVGGFTSDGERDRAMTAGSTEDLAWIRPGRERSGTARNLERRKKSS